jgi:hypothetical protein
MVIACAGVVFVGTEAAVRGPSFGTIMVVDGTAGKQTDNREYLQ